MQMLKLYYHPESILRRAASNKPVHLIGGRTIHFGQDLIPEHCMRTVSLAVKAQSRQKFSFTHDESSQLQGELDHAASLRAAYTHITKYGLNPNIYSGPRKKYGRIVILCYSQDNLLLPPLPSSSSMLAPLEGTSDEHKVDAQIFKNAELVFQFNTAMRFTDETLIEILKAMRTPGGRRFSHAQWQALVNTQCSAEQPADVPDVQRSDLTWHHVCYCWTVMTMSAYLLARVSAQKAAQTLFYAQSLPAVVRWHQGMRIKFTTTLQQPFVVQDVECTVVGFDPDDKDYDAKMAVDAQHCQGEHVCGFMPKAIYVKIDDCDCHFLPPAPCCLGRAT